jgi:hypothetical protein
LAGVYRSWIRACPGEPATAGGNAGDEDRPGEWRPKLRLQAIASGHRPTSTETKNRETETGAPDHPTKPGRVVAHPRERTQRPSPSPPMSSPSSSVSSVTGTA